MPTNDEMMARIQATPTSYHVADAQGVLLAAPCGSVDEVCTALGRLPDYQMIVVGQQVGEHSYPGTPMPVSQYRGFFDGVRDMHRGLTPLSHRRRYTKKQSK